MFIHKHQASKLSKYDKRGQGKSVNVEGKYSNNVEWNDERLSNMTIG